MKKKLCWDVKVDKKDVFTPTKNIQKKIIAAITAEIKKEIEKGSVKQVALCLIDSSGEVVVQKPIFYLNAKEDPRAASLLFSKSPIEKELGDLFFKQLRKTVDREFVDGFIKETMKRN